MTKDQYIELALQQGFKMFQAFYLHQTAEGHASMLLDYLSPPPAARLLDIGCGVGSISSNWAQAAPSMQFVNLNIDEYELSHIPMSLHPLRAHGNVLPFAGGSFDCVLLLFSIGYLSLIDVLTEAYRVLKVNGTVLVYDMLASPDGPLQNIGYVSPSIEMMKYISDGIGFSIHIKKPTIWYTHEQRAFCSDPTYDAVFSGTKPILYFLTKYHPDLV